MNLGRSVILMVNDRKSSMDYSFNELDEMEKEFDYLSKQFYGD